MTSIAKDNIVLKNLNTKAIVYSPNATSLLDEPTHLAHHVEVDSKLDKERGKNILRAKIVPRSIWKFIKEHYHYSDTWNHLL